MYIKNVHVLEQVCVVCVHVSVGMSTMAAATSPSINATFPLDVVITLQTFTTNMS